MPKKTRKKTTEKSSKNGTGKTARASAKTAAQKPAAKTRPAAAKKPVKAAKATTLKSASKASAKKPKASPKKPPTPKAAPRPKIPAAKPAATKPLAIKPSTNSTLDAKSTSEAKADPSTSPKAVEGAKAPAFRLPRDGGQTVSLADYAGQKLVLFFYPRADTPGCTKEAIDFTRLGHSFAKAQTVVVGVSADPLRAQESFRNKHTLTVPLVSDEKHEMLEAYGAWGEKSMYGKTFHGVLRTTVLIGANGRIIRIWRHVKVDGHADEVLEAVQAA